MNHYFTNNDNLKKTKNTFLVEFKKYTYTFSTLTGVFSKSKADEGSLLLLESVPSNKKVVIDMGAGYGLISIVYAKENPNSLVYAYEINLDALSLVKESSIKNQVNNIIASYSDGFNSVDITADLIIINPPIKAGKKVYYKMFEDSIKHLRDDGIFMIVMKKNHGALSALDKLKSLYDVVDIVRKKRGFYVIKAQKSKFTS